MEAKQGDLGKMEGRYRVLPQTAFQETRSGWTLVQPKTAVKTAPGVFGIRVYGDRIKTVYAPDGLTLTGPLFYFTVSGEEPKRIAEDLIDYRKQSLTAGRWMFRIFAFLMFIGASAFWFNPDVGIFPSAFLGAFGIAHWIYPTLHWLFVADLLVPIVDADIKAQVSTIAFPGAERDRDSGDTGGGWVPMGGDCDGGGGDGGDGGGD